MWLSKNYVTNLKKSKKGFGRKVDCKIKLRRGERDAVTMKKILLITTGGTIASSKSENGLVPTAKGKGLLYYVSALENLYDITICDLLRLDSSNIQPEEWQIMAREIYKEKGNYDAIVMTHGTDTMAYTASVLSYMLLGIEIPVVITGSQLPMDHPLTDAVSNLFCAFEMANSGIAGVFIAFDRQILLGCRSVKVRASNFRAFESINASPVAVMDSHGLNINKEVLLKSQAECSLKDRVDNKVFLLKLTPGTDPNILPAMADLGCSGIVIEAFGSGGINFIRRDLVGMLDKMTAKDIPVVVCSQCLYDKSDLNAYEVGRKALEKGVISAYDMTSESAVTKLMWALGQIKGENRTEKIKNIFAQNLAGEIKIEASVIK